MPCSAGSLGIHCALPNCTLHAGEMTVHNMCCIAIHSLEHKPHSVVDQVVQWLPILVDIPLLAACPKLYTQQSLVTQLCTGFLGRAAGGILQPGRAR